MEVVRLDAIPGMRFPAGRHTRVLVGEGGLNAESFCQGYVVIPPGAGVPEHTHPQEEVYLILSGTGEMTIQAELRDSMSGELLAIYGGDQDVGSEYQQNVRINKEHNAKTLFAAWGEKVRLMMDESRM